MSFTTDGMVKNSSSNVGRKFIFFEVDKFMPRDLPLWKVNKVNFVWYFNVTIESHTPKN